MERIELKAYSSQAKSIGTIICIVGALVVTLCKGPPIINFSHLTTLHLPLFLYQSNWILGGLLLALAAFLLALVHIVQAWIIKDYPAELMVTIICCFLTAIQLAVVALITERNNPKAWVLKPDMELVTICYSAIGLISLRNVVHIWALRKKGPVYVVMFKPLGIVIAVGMGVAFLGDILHIGSVIGGVLIAVGFYALLWGKSIEMKGVDDQNGLSCSSSSYSSTKVPLLPIKTLDI